MKILKKIAVAIAVLFALYLVVCAFGDKTFQAEESIVIDAPANEIYDNLADFKNHTEWGSWFRLDPNMTIEYVNDGKGIGGKSIWKSEHAKVGNGSQEFVTLEPNKYIRTKLNFAEDDQDNYASFTLTSEGKSTKVAWIMEPSEVPFMGRGFMLLMNFEGMVSESFQEGLRNMKEIIEA